MFSHRLETEAGRLVRNNRDPVNDRKGVLCNVIEDIILF